MKKMLLNGISLVFATLISTVLFAGNGEGDGKGKTTLVQVTGMNQSGHYEFFISTPAPEQIDMSNVHVQTKDGRSVITSISILTSGILVGVEVEPVSNYSSSDDEVIIYEVVGIDNITGITPAQNNNPTYASIHINFTQEEGTTPNNGTSTANPTASGVVDNGALEMIPVSNLSSDITIYPNPISTDVNVVTVGEILGKSINIMDLTGKMVFTSAVGEDARTLTFDVSFLKPGIYILNFETKNGRIISKRIVKS